jgi:lysophospholipase L1-like esterase
MKYKLILAIIFTGVLLLTGCEKEAETVNPASLAETSTEKVTEITEETVLTTTEKKSDKFYDNVKHLGRTYISDDILWCALSGTGAEFTASGEKLVITFKGGNAAMNANNEKSWARVAVYVNNERVVDTQIDKAIKVVEVPLVPAETSTVKIIKLSEAVQSIIGISNITVDGVSSGISPVAENDFLIEFVGDSITCGYGVDAPDQNENFSTATEDFTDTYAYLTAANFGADYSAVAFSGHGIISGYTGNGVKQPGQIVPQFYGKIGNSYDTIDGKYLSDIDWEFAEKPDLIVVNLGTNDDSYCGDDPERQAEFTEKYIEFLGELRRINPDSVILCTLGVLGDRLCPFIEDAVKSYSESSGDKNIFSMRFDVQNYADGYGADWHPSAATHEKMAEKLIGWINENIQI